MRFIDEARIRVIAGDGGRGCVSFRREKFVPRGGPDGGNGGKGGDVILVGDDQLESLIDFRYKRHYKTKSGAHGKGKNQRGRDGADLLRHRTLDLAGKTRLVRVSTQLYNTPDDYERLAAALLTLL